MIYDDDHDRRPKNNSCNHKASVKTITCSDNFIFVSIDYDGRVISYGTIDCGNVTMYIYFKKQTDDIIFFLRQSGLIGELEFVNFKYLM